MKPRTWFFISILTLIASPVIGRAAAQAENLPPESDSGAVVCTPGVYLSEPDDCLPLGPSVYLTSLARLGLSVPPAPLPSLKPDSSLTQLPYRYFHLDKDYVPILGAPGDTAGGLEFPPGFIYISYVDRVDNGHGIYYLMQAGGWIP